MTPSATYRLQFRSGFGFAQAAEIVPYLARLGVSHVYASPIFAATPGSTHGYDVTDFNRIEPEIGGEEGLAACEAALKAEGIGLVLDFVPNHMGASPFNGWWRDVLEWGQRSQYARHFDIDWTAEKLIVPALGAPYGRVLTSGDIRLALVADTGRIVLRYFGLELPLSPASYAPLLQAMEDPELEPVILGFAVAGPNVAAEQHERLAAFLPDNGRAARLQRVLDAVASDRDRLHELHERQNWRLAYWRAARESLTYRRFFEIADLVGVRIESPPVFDDVHRLVLQMVGEGRVDGLRIDHVDGLADPAGYLQTLQRAIPGDDPFYVVVEKILGPGERLPERWPVAGTTGYEFITALAGLLVDGRGEVPLTQAYEAFLGGATDFHALVRDTKRWIFTRNLAGELERLKEMATEIAGADAETRDIGPDSLRRAILAVTAEFPVYRTYVDLEGPSDADRALLGRALDAARQTRDVEDEGAIDFLDRLVRLDFADAEVQGRALAFTRRLQQTTGPVMAKALEDTSFYRYARLLALNEVGGEPTVFATSLDAFHAGMARRLAEQPDALSTTATHDTKRGEDARARLYTISERPETWADAVRRWSERLAPHRAQLDGGPAPEPEMEWHLFQALLAILPHDLAPDDAHARQELCDRLEAYMVKAVREAKLRTSWSVPAEDYEGALKGFVTAALADDAFVEDFRDSARPFVAAGRLNSFAQTAIKLTAPGVPDVYNGTEGWDLSLVDPDNRRPIDFERLSGWLDAESPATFADPSAWVDGRAKQFLVREGLRLRRERPDLSRRGRYAPIAASGPAAEHVVAFARVGEDGAGVVTVALRHTLSLFGDRVTDGWDATPLGGTTLSLADLGASGFEDRISGRTVEAGAGIDLASLLGVAPVALLAAV